MNSRSHILRRQARDFSNGSRIHLLEIRDDDLAIERLKLLISVQMRSSVGL
jgi:hypothetical protein